MLPAEDTRTLPNKTVSHVSRAKERTPRSLTGFAVLLLSLIMTTGCGGAAAGIHAGASSDGAGSEASGAGEGNEQPQQAVAESSGEATAAPSHATGPAETDDEQTSAEGGTDATAEPAATQDASEPAQGTSTESEAAPAPAAARRAMMRRGKRAFEARCDTCHPGGDEDIGPKITGIRWPVHRMEKQIREGSGRMRPITTAKLSDADLDALMVYLARLGAVRGVGRR